MDILKSFFCSCETYNQEEEEYQAYLNKYRDNINKKEKEDFRTSNTKTNTFSMSKNNIQIVRETKIK